MQPADVHEAIFICQFNSARSQIAEALACHHMPSRRWLSAGLHATVVNERVAQVLAREGVRTQHLRSKSLRDVANARVGGVIVLAREAIEPVRAAFPGVALEDWSMPDPLHAGDESQVQAAIGECMRIIRERLLARFCEVGP